jgi:hypothetical protein
MITLRNPDLESIGNRLWFLPRSSARASTAASKRRAFVRSSWISEELGLLGERLRNFRNLRIDLYGMRHRNARNLNYANAHFISTPRKQAC